jgi:hypothetical protein
MSLVDRMHPHGCFINNCASEIAHRDPQAREAVRRAIAGLGESYSDAVARGQRAGEITNTTDARVLGHYLVTNIFGVLAVRQGGLDREALRRIHEVVLSVLD